MPARAGYNCSFPSVHDPYQAPPGQCVRTHLADGAVRPEGRRLREMAESQVPKRVHVEEQIAMLQQYAPNLTTDKVLLTYLTTPADIQNKFANMVKGGYKQGAYHPLQMGYLRPNQYCSQYRTPIKNLYVGGASVAPGGWCSSGPDTTAPTPWPRTSPSRNGGRSRRTSPRLGRMGMCEAAYSLWRMAYGRRQTLRLRPYAIGHTPYAEQVYGVTHE